MGEYVATMQIKDEAIEGGEKKRARSEMNGDIKKLSLPVCSQKDTYDDNFVPSFTQTYTSSEELEISKTKHSLAYEHSTISTSDLSVRSNETHGFSELGTDTTMTTPLKTDSEANDSDQETNVSPSYPEGIRTHNRLQSPFLYTTHIAHLPTPQHPIRSLHGWKVHLRIDVHPHCRHPNQEEVEELWEQYQDEPMNIEKTRKLIRDKGIDVGFERNGSELFKGLINGEIRKAFEESMEIWWDSRNEEGGWRWGWDR